MCLESVMTPGQYVGVLPNGQVQPPTNTHTGANGRFIVTVKSGAEASSSSSGGPLVSTVEKSTVYRIAGNFLEALISLFSLWRAPKRK